MALEISQITSITFQFLEQNYLNQFKRQVESRVKPSKAVLQALKHSTNLNKSFKTQIQSLKSQLSSVAQQNEFLKNMIQNLKKQVQFVKTSKQDKIKKLCQIQTKLHTQVQFLTNQNKLLKKQIQLIKLKHQSNNNQTSNISIKNNLFSQLKHKLQNHKYQSQIHNNQNQHFQVNLSSSPPLHQSVKFNQYLNCQQKQQQNRQTRPNSKFKIQFIQQNSPFQYKKSSFGKKQCQQLTKMLNLRHQSNDNDDSNQQQEQNEQSPQKRQFSSLQSISPKITQITSQQQIFVQQQNDRVQTPTLQKVNSQNVNQSKFKVFEPQQKPKRQSLYYNKGSQFTFLNLQTRKSIQQSKSSQNNFPHQNIKISIQNNQQNKHQLFKNQLNTMDQQIYLENISGVDVMGLIQDIQGGDNEQNQNDYQDQQVELQDNFYYKDNNQFNQFDQFDSSTDLKKVRTKKTQSQVFCPQKIKSIHASIKATQQKQQQKQQKDKIILMTSIIRQKQSQKMKIQVHEPIKYVTVAESFKTIDFSKSNKRINSIQNQSKSSTNKNQTSQQIKNNSSSLLSKSRHQNSSSPRSMMNSKLMLYSNVRRNAKNKTLSPLSIQNQVKDNQPKSPSNTSQIFSQQKTPKSYSLLHSIRNKKLNASTINNRSVIHFQKSQNQPQNDLSVKNNEQKMSNSVHPTVTFKGVNNEIKDQQLQFQEDGIPDEN